MTMFDWKTYRHQIAWPRPTRPDDVLRVESEVIGIADGDAVRIRTVKLVMPRRAAR
jgi:acyl dehydratase